MMELRDHLKRIDKKLEAYKYVITLIENGYLQLEKEQIINAVDGFPLASRGYDGQGYYDKTYKDE